MAHHVQCTKKDRNWKKVIIFWSQAVPQNYVISFLKVLYKNMLTTKINVIIIRNHRKLVTDSVHMR